MTNQHIVSERSCPLCRGFAYAIICSCFFYHLRRPGNFNICNDFYHHNDCFNYCFG